MLLSEMIWATQPCGSDCASLAFFFLKYIYIKKMGKNANSFQVVAVELSQAWAL
jgi:hypothetical protein